jgi:phosphatidylglycerophosphate synthase
MKDSDLGRLRAAIKTRDAWWARDVVGPLANRVVGWIEPLPFVTPNRVTLASLAVGLVAAALIAEGRQPALALGGIVLQISFLLDCVDGQLSRFRDSSSLFGAILDRLCDRVKLFGVVLGLAYGLFRVTQDCTPLFLGFGYFFCEYMIEVYVQSYRRFEADATPRGSGESRAVAAAVAPLRILDLPLIQLGFADRYLLVSCFTVAGATHLLLWLLIFLGILHLVLRPVYYVLSLRLRFGDWPWNDERRHRLGENF